MNWTCLFLIGTCSTWGATDAPFTGDAESISLSESGARIYGQDLMLKRDTPLRLVPGPHLFIDDYYFETAEGVSRVVNVPERDARIPNPIVAGKEDGCFQPYMTVLRDGETGRFRLWFGRRTDDSNASRSRLGYMESPDGIHWERPARVLDDPGGPIQFGVSVVDDGAGAANPAQRYKYAWWFDGGLRIATSPDGLVWAPLSPAVLIRQNHDITGLFYDPIRSRYTATISVYRPGETWQGNRRISMHSHSADLLHWARPRYVVLPETGVDEGETQFYAMDGYLARGDLLVGMVKVLRDDLKADDPPDPPEAYGVGYTSLAWSRDGETWWRDPAHYFNPDPIPGAWDHAHAWIDEQVLVGDEVYLYYGGYARGHKINRFEERQIGLVTVARDRYAGWAGQSAPGRIVTAPLILEGAALSVNARVDGVWVKGQITDAAGKAIEGFTFADAAPLTGDKVAHLLSWKRPLDELAEKPVRLEFELTNATLYAVEMFANMREAVETTMPVTRWEDTICKLEQRLAKEQPAKGATVFAGSSTMVLWDLPKFFPNIATVNCGFSGSHLRDSVYYADRLIIPLAPKAIVVYAGDNDIAQGLTAEDVADDFGKFAQKICVALPETRILYLSIKPSLARWDKWPVMDRANKLIEKFCRTDERVEFVDMTGMSLGPDGKPRADFLRKDGLHLNEKGYAAWTEVLASRLTGRQARPEGRL
ncbi:MAG: GDSL-type esterase/lipase family protein [Candidatus Hydrogenedentes bacterium]|nr:GDSL-type esterase/lipase family protein [Candidatus Hydrogenedentota bacterium]